MKAALVEALARYDQWIAKCPINNPKGRPAGDYPRCSRCGADESQCCGLDASASYALIQELRALAEGDAA